ncbi:MAG: cytochrome P450 [Acidimicrobiia bacterium]|nr:cytochrome P450 [Acidimicrobiia bacterium]
MTGAARTGARPEDRDHELDPGEIDVLDPAVYAHDPYPMYRWLLRHDPVHWDRHSDIWVVTRYDDVCWVERNPEIFCSSKGVRPDQPGGISIITMDAPDHTMHRRLVNKGFTPRMVRKLATHIEELTAGVLDRVAAAGECDFVADIAYRVPLIVICELLGLPVEDWKQLGAWSDGLVGSQGARSTDDPAFEAATQAFIEYTGYLQELIAAKREDPGDDLVSLMIHQADAGVIATGEVDAIREKVIRGDADGKVSLEDLAEIGQDELVMFLILLLVAGNETTRNAMSGGIATLSDEPQQWARLVEDPSLVDSAVEEVLRWVSPVLNFSRTVTTDTELHGREIREGDKVLVVYGAANRDPAVFDDPDEFRVDRDPNHHIAFGIGPHFCLGANLARLELQILYRQLVRRFPDLRVAPGAGPVRVPNCLVRTIDELPVVFTPAPAA